MSATPRLLGIKAAAHYLGATPWFVRSQLWAGNLPYLQLGKRFVIDVQDLDRFVEAKKAGRL